ncbi:MAG: excisionase family DNA-binding protein [Deltaproteobacteria bacterium]|nr:excisionase family DNA-binding protein [Deltaproteobacteria bacterium]
MSSGQAARYCLVSPDTIVNWIAGGKIPAQRTVGGQFRIRLKDLRVFMLAHGMRTDQLDSDMGFQPVCWEFWASLPDRVGHRGGPTCGDCPVYRSRATVCREIRPLLPGGTVRAPSCQDCLFFSSLRETDDDERSTTGKG